MEGADTCVTVRGMKSTVLRGLFTWRYYGKVAVSPELWPCFSRTVLNGPASELFGFGKERSFKLAQ